MAVYTAYISGICCLQGDYIIPTTCNQNIQLAIAPNHPTVPPPSTGPEVYQCHSIFKGFCLANSAAPKPTYLWKSRPFKSALSDPKKQRGCDFLVCFIDSLKVFRKTLLDPMSCCFTICIFPRKGKTHRAFNKKAIKKADPKPLISAPVSDPL